MSSRTVAKSQLKDYFGEARSWEANKVASSERSRLLAWYIATGATAVALATSVSTILLATRQPDAPIVLRVNDTTGSVDVVARLKGGDTTYDEVTRKYWTELYVREREGYSRELAEDYYNSVGLMSGSLEQHRFAEWFGPKNPLSPLNLYGETMKVKIAIKGSSFISKNVLLVRYTRAVERPGSEKPELSFWAATVVIKFVAAPMSEKDRRINPLGFQVVEYRIDPDAASPAIGSTPQPVAPPPAPVVSTQPPVVVFPDGAGPTRQQVPAIAVGVNP